MSNNENANLALSTLIEEYRTLRQESLQAIQSRISIANFCFASLAFASSIVISNSVSPAISCLVLAFAVPQLSSTTAHVWIGEHKRSLRAGKALADIEKKVNEIIGSETLRWESDLRKWRHEQPPTAYGHMTKLFKVISRSCEMASIYYFVKVLTLNFPQMEIQWIVYVSTIFLIFVAGCDIWRERAVNQAWNEANMFSGYGNGTRPAASGAVKKVSP